MDIKKILNNIRLNGFSATYKIYKDNKYNKKNKDSIDLINDLKEKLFSNLEVDIINLFEQASSKDISVSERERLYSIISMKENIAKKDYLKEGKDKKNYHKYLRSKYVKEIIPQVYEEYSKKPIENIIVFMERGKKKSPSLNYMYRKIKEEKKYDVSLHELKVREVPEAVHYENVVRYIKDMATAKAVFICTANEYLAYIPELRKETKYIQLWHGCGAFKKVGLSTIDNKFGKSAKEHLEYPQNTHYTYVTVASNEVSRIFEESMGIDKDSGVIVDTGISRTDEFFDQEYLDSCYRKLYKIIPEAKNKKIILYAPTFRGEVSKAVSPNELDIEKFYNEFKDDYILILKHHQSVKNTPEISEKYENVFAFDMTRGKGVTINDLMSVADIMITDYSSVTFEYSLFERPMIFFAYDLEDYIDYRGLYYDFNEITPGPVVKTNEEMIDYIKNIDTRFDKQEVVDFKNKFMSACDGHSSERILKLIEE